MGQKTIDELVRAEEGLVSRSIFVDEEIFQQELKQIFSRAWLFVRKPIPLDNFSLLWRLKC